MGNWGGANRPVTSNKLGIPTKAEGADGDLQIRQTQLGAKLFGKIGGRWYDNPFSIDGVTKIGTNLSEHLSISSAGIEIVKADKKVAFFGSTARIGEDSTSTSALRVAADGALTIGTSATSNFSVSALGVVSITTGDITLTPDAGTVVAGDQFLFLDENDSNSTKKAELSTLATLFAGTGLTASSSVIGVDASQTQITGVGTITTGVWNAGAVTSSAGLSGTTGTFTGNITMGDDSSIGIADDA